MPSPYDLTTLEAAATRLKVSTADVELPSLITAASRAVSRHVGYELHRREGLTESVAGHGGRYLFLRAGAVQSVQRVEECGAEVPPDAYRLESPLMGRIARRRGCWPFTGRTSGGISNTPLQAEATGELVVTYTAGWVTPGQVALAREADAASTLVSDLEPDIAEAALITVTAWYRRKGRDADVASVGLGDSSQSFAGTGPLAVPTLAQGLLAPYRKPTRMGS